MYYKNIYIIKKERYIKRRARARARACVCVCVCVKFVHNN